MSADTATSERTWEPEESGIRMEVRGIVARVSRIDILELEDDVLIREELGVDSLMAMEIVALCEKALEIQIDEEHLFEIQTIGDFIELVFDIHQQKGR